MGKFCVVVIGPAGSGKSTFCRTLCEHYASRGRTSHICNFDPAAEDPLAYSPSLDVRDLISLEDAMDAKGLGPNGGLVFCMEHLISNAAWLHDAVEDFADDFLICDMPGQIEVMSHIPVVPQFVDLMRQEGYSVCVAFLLDALAATADAGKFVSGCLFSLSSMVAMDCPFVNVLTKCDLLEKDFRDESLEHFCMCDFDFLSTAHLPARWQQLARALSGIISDYGLVSYKPLDITNDDYIANIAMVIDNTMQVEEDAEVRDRDIDFGGGGGDDNDRLYEAASAAAAGAEFSFE